MENGQLYQMILNSPSLPQIPADLSEIILLLQDPDRVDIDQLVKRVSELPKLETIILSYINSPYFRMRRKISSLREAIILLGMQTVQVVIIASVCQYLFPHGYARSNIFNKVRYIRHSIGVSIISCALAEELRGGDRYQLFAYGLMHDIGIALMDACFPELVDAVYARIMKGSHQIIAEREVLGGACHPEVGAWIAERWSFPPNMINIIKNHHWPRIAEDNTYELQLIHLADIISANYYENMLLEYTRAPSSLALQNDLGIDQATIDRVTAELPAEVTRVMGLFTMQ